MWCLYSEKANTVCPGNSCGWYCRNIEYHAVAMSCLVPVSKVFMYCFQWVLDSRVVPRLRSCPWTEFQGSDFETRVSSEPLWFLACGLSGNHSLRIEVLDFLCLFVRSSVLFSSKPATNIPALLSVRLSFVIFQPVPGPINHQHATSNRRQALGWLVSSLVPLAPGSANTLLVKSITWVGQRTSCF